MLAECIFVVPLDKVVYVTKLRCLGSMLSRQKECQSSPLEHYQSLESAKRVQPLMERGGGIALDFNNGAIPSRLCALRFHLVKAKVLLKTIRCSYNTNESALALWLKHTSRKPSICPLRDPL